MDDSLSRQNSPSGGLTSALASEACAPGEGSPQPIGAPEDWMMPFSDFLQRGNLPDGATDARRLVQRAKSYKLAGGQIYRRSASGVLLQCVPPKEGKKLLLDIHAGIYAHHAAPRALVVKSFRHGFYWPTALTDARDIIRTCKG
ncbi:uncharacterized protein [Miscanthus floridulus]|uniref:uncharacterized protein n=1 Tax=Miscanthus floridulus TaxID=154761 RepID=UPI0034598150